LRRGIVCRTTSTNAAGVSTSRHGWPAKSDKQVSSGNPSRIRFAMSRITGSLSKEADNMKTTRDKSGHFWIQHPNDNGFTEVTKIQFMLVERAEGFVNAVDQPNEPSTAAFSGPAGVKGTTTRPDNIASEKRFTKDQTFYSRAGESIPLEQWAAEWATDRVLRDDPIPGEQPGETFYLRTVYHGMIDEAVTEARLYCTAIVRTVPVARGDVIAELDTYDSATQAYVGHLEHLDAILLGHHCHYCRTGKTRNDEAAQPKG
jgi:hypothetical protein